MSQNSSSGGRALFPPPTALPIPRTPRGTQNFRTQGPVETQPGVMIHQYVGPQSWCPNFFFQTPGTYNMGVTLNTPTGSHGPRSPPPTDSSWMTQTIASVRTPWQGRNMGAQTSPGLRGNFGGQSPSQGGGSQSP